MRLPSDLSSIKDTRLIGYWNDKIPLYEVSSPHGLNQIVGYVKHTNANSGTVLYRGQTRLHEKLIPSILHRLSSDAELTQRKTNLENYIDKIAADPRMQSLLNFDETTSERHFFKRYVIESMLQHYGLKTHCQDFVDNHWTALWFGLYELRKEPMHGCPRDSKYTQNYYARRNPILDEKHKAPECITLKKPEPLPIPSPPELQPITPATDYTIVQLKDQKNVKRINAIKDQTQREIALQRLIHREIEHKTQHNQKLLKKWEEQKSKTTATNKQMIDQYNIDQESDIAYMYLLLYVADTKGENFRGVYAGTETITIDLRKALPSVLLRPCAQHGWTVRRIGDYADLSEGVVCVLRLRVDLVDKMMGTGTLVTPDNFFPSPERDNGYRILLGREEPAPFGSPPPKNPRDLPSLFPFATLQHFSNK